MSDFPFMARSAFIGHVGILKGDVAVYSDVPIRITRRVLLRELDLWFGRDSRPLAVAEHRDAVTPADESTAALYNGIARRWYATTLTRSLRYCVAAVSWSR